MATRQVFGSLSKSITKVLAAKPVSSLPRSRTLYSAAAVKTKNIGQKFPFARKNSDAHLFLGTTLVGTTQYRSRSDEVHEALEVDPIKEKIIENMKSGKFTKQERYYSEYERCSNSIAGSDILRTKVNHWNSKRWSLVLFGLLEKFAIPLQMNYYNSKLTKIVMGLLAYKFQVFSHELIDTMTGSVEKINLPGNEAILTPSHIVTIMGKKVLEIRCRETGETKRIKFPADTETKNVHWGKYHYQRLIKNNNPDCSVILFESARDSHVVNLETKKFAEINLHGKGRVVQFYNDLITLMEDVYSEGSTTYTLTVLKANGTVLLKLENLPRGGLDDDVCYMDQPDQIVISSFKDTEISWKVVNMNGDIISEGKFAVPKYQTSDFPQVTACKDWIIFNRNQLNIVDRSTGNLLTSLDLQAGIITDMEIDRATLHKSSSQSYPQIQVQEIDDGRFLIASNNSAQILDFEIADEVPEVNAVVVEKDGETLTQIRGKMNEIMQAFKFARYEEGIQSVIVYLTDKERIGLVYFAESDFALEKYKEKIESVQWYPHPGISYISPKQFEKQDKTALFFQEEWVNGKWIHADMSTERAKEMLLN